jgi:hypothetical protein
LILNDPKLLPCLSPNCEKGRILEDPFP